MCSYLHFILINDRGSDYAHSEAHEGWTVPYYERRGPPPGGSPHASGVIRPRGVSRVLEKGH